MPQPKPSQPTVNFIYPQLTSNLTIAGATWGSQDEVNYEMSLVKQWGCPNYHISRGFYQTSDGKIYYFPHIIGMDNNNIANNVLFVINKHQVDSMDGMHDYFISIGGTESDWNNKVFPKLV